MENEKEFQTEEPTEEPIETPDPGADEPEEPEIPDLDSLAKAYNMTPAQVIKSYGEAQKKITMTSQQLAEYRRNMQWAEQFKHELSTRKGLREHIESFFDEDRGAVPSEVKSAIDPVYQDVNQLKAYVYNLEMNQKLDGIEKDGFPMNQEIRAAIFEEVARTSNPDVEAIYWKQNGRTLAMKPSDRESRAAMEERNRKAYVNNRGSAAKPRTPDVRSMPQADWSRALDEELASAFRRTE